VKVAGWFHWVIFPVAAKDQMYNIKADGFWRKRNIRRVTKIANSSDEQTSDLGLNPARQDNRDVIRLFG